VNEDSRARIERLPELGLTAKQEVCLDELAKDPALAAPHQSHVVEPATSQQLIAFQCRQGAQDTSNGHVGSGCLEQPHSFRSAEDFLIALEDEGVTNERVMAHERITRLTLVHCYFRPVLARQQ
jgi:hypothetical protein